MNKIVFCTSMTLAAAMIVACNKQESPAPDNRTTPESSQQAAGPVAPAPASTPAPGRPIPAPADNLGVDALAAAGVTFEFPHRVLYDILDASNSGKERHRVLVEISDGELKQVAESFGQSLEALGYRSESDKESGGRIDRVYSADGKPTYYLIMQPAGMGPKLSGPDSTGSLHIMWNIPPGS